MTALKPCGTPAAYKRHRYYDEEPCDACRDAVARYVRERQKVRCAEQGITLQEYDRRTHAQAYPRLKRTNARAAEIIGAVR